jgi:hypothetical protein
MKGHPTWEVFNAVSPAFLLTVNFETGFSAKLSHENLGPTFLIDPCVQLSRFQ